MNSNKEISKDIEVDEFKSINEEDKVNKKIEVSEIQEVEDVGVEVVQDINEILEVPEINISKIVDLGVKPKKSFFNYLKDMIKEIGLKNIFNDKNEITFISLLITSIVIFVMFNISQNANEINSIYRFIFIVSPILYIVILLFSFFNKKEKGTFELEMICKYNLYQMLALRMFIFSIVSTIVNTIMILFVFAWKQDISVLRAICISITGLFLFSSMFIYICIATKKSVSKFLLVVSWVVINMGIYIIDNEIYDAFLVKVPLYIHLIVTLICIIFYIKNLKKFINFRSERGVF